LLDSSKCFGLDQILELFCGLRIQLYILEKSLVLISLLSTNVTAVPSCCGGALIKFIH